MLNELFEKLIYEDDIDKKKDIAKRILEDSKDVEEFFYQKLVSAVELMKSYDEHDEEFYILETIYFLYELDSEKSLDLILESLKNDEEIIEIEFGDILNDVFWRVFVKLGRNVIDKLIEFSKDRTVDSNCRFVVLRALQQMCSAIPERKEELKELIEKLITDKTEDELLRLLLIELADELGMKKLRNICKNILDSIEWVPETIDAFSFVEKDFSDFKEHSIYDFIEEYRQYTAEAQEEMLSKLKELYEDITLGDETIYDDEFEYHEPRHIVKVGRNDPCPCGSGKKYKKCCGK